MAPIRAIASWFNARRRIVALVLVGWVVLIVVAAGEPPTADTRFVVPDLGNLVLGLGVLVALVGLALILYLRPSVQGGLVPRRIQTLRTWAFMAIALVLFALTFGPEETGDDETTAEPDTTTIAQPVDDGGSDGQSPQANDIGVVVLVLIGVVAGAVLVRTRRPIAAAPFGDEPDLSLEADLSAAVDDATYQLQLGGVPRLAVVAAYASLEQALAERGHSREPAETPTEHMARVLMAVPVLAVPAVRLGQLYEIARFSDRPISEADRHRAADELARATRSLVDVSGDQP